MKHSFVSFKICSLILFSCISCSDNKEIQQELNEHRTQIFNVLDYWIDRKMNLDYNVGFFTTRGRDTLEYQNQNADFKILRYIDSTGCTPCRLQLAKYGEVLYELMDSAECTVDFLCIVTTSDLSQIKTATASNPYMQPIWVDPTDSINRLNSFPIDYRLQTFLLDSNDRVLAIGDPLLNPNVKDLYLQIMTNDSTNIPRTPDTIISSDESEINLGDIQHGEIITYQIPIKNDGDYTFYCKEVTTSCDCTLAKLIPDQIEPGQVGILDIVITGQEQLGEMFRSVSIFGNISDEYSIDIIGTII